MLPHQLELSFIIGFAAQWLRQYPWYSDKLHVSLAVALALAISVGEAHAFNLGVFYGALQLAQAVLGGTFVAHALSHSESVSGLIPKYNSVANPQ
jgi:hypothetical protein